MTIMEFRTSVRPFSFDFKINHRSKIILAGSCFAENLFQKLKYHKFSDAIHPFGTVYHPINLSWLLRRGLEGHKVTPEEIFENQGLFSHFQFNKHFSGSLPEHCIDAANTALAETGVFLKNADLLVLTLGTANGYIFKETGELVGNCHKIPARYFEKIMSTIREMEEELSLLIKEMLLANPQIKIIITVSPVRHTKDGLESNLRSKARLIEVAHRISDAFPDHTFYFPSYEIMMDDLRDYRFYQSDMIHPSDLAVDYIWDYFSNAVFEQYTLEINKKIDHIQKSLLHRPIHGKSLPYLEFIQKLLDEMEQLMEIESEIDFTEEIQSLWYQLKSS